jgi:hypothetical protein
MCRQSILGLLLLLAVASEANAEDAGTAMKIFGIIGKMSRTRIGGAARAN